MKMVRSIVVVLAAVTGLAGFARGEGVPPLMMGAAWYPEQWSEAQWEADLQKMQDAGLNMVRIGEFAWSSLEPEEGKYDLDWMERAVDAAARHGIVTIVGTPTDTPPAWLTSKYPEVLRVTEEGVQMQHGSRRHFSIGSSKYRELCAGIVGKLAERFGHNPHVIGWQIGNEYTEDSFDPESRRKFHEWLEVKYGSLDALNKHWVTAYWSQTYSDWSQIPMTTGRANPGLLLDYKRFVTDTWRSFQKNQLDVLRKRINARQVITTNLGGLGWANRFNREVIARDLDLISWDEYVGSGHLDPVRMGSTHDLVRGWKQRNFWVLEIQPAFVDWAGVSNALDKGETRAMCWHAVGHGADCVAFWQWRSALNGQEQYHGSLVGPDGEPVPLYPEVAQLGREFAKAGKVLTGTTPVSQVALIHDYDSRWAIEFNKFSKLYDQMEVLEDYYRVLREQAQSVDIVVPTVDLSRYKLVVAPSLNVVSADLARQLTDYVKAGGHLVLGPRTGMKDEFNALNTQRQPGPLVDTLGGRVEQFYALSGGQNVPVSGDWGQGEASIWAERLEITRPDAGAEVLMKFGAGDDWLTGRPAVIRRKVGKGTITYLGSVLDEHLMEAMAKTVVAEAEVDSPVLIAPEGVDVCRRVGGGREVWVLTNFSKGAKEVALPGPMTDVLGGETVERVSMPRYGVAVLTRPAN